MVAVIGVSVLVLVLILTMYFCFFATGGCISLFRTALNDELRADGKLRWMLAQVYFPPTTIAYLALKEKSRKFQILGAIGIVVASILTVYKLTHIDWGKFFAGVPAVYGSLKEAADKEEKNKANHKQEKVLNDKADALGARLTKIKESVPANKMNVTLARLSLFQCKLNYASGKLSEVQYAQLLQKLDAMTAKGSLSLQEVKVWSDEVTYLITHPESNSNLNSPPPATPQPQTQPAEGKP